MDCNHHSEISCYTGTAFLARPGTVFAYVNLKTEPPFAHELVRLRVIAFGNFSPRMFVRGACVEECVACGERPDQSDITLCPMGSDGDGCLVRLDADFRWQGPLGVYDSDEHIDHDQVDHLAAAVRARLAREHEKRAGGVAAPSTLTPDPDGSTIPPTEASR